MGEGPFESCANCGEPFEKGVTYPVETEPGPDGEPIIYSFCDEACRGEWAEE